MKHLEAVLARKLTPEEMKRLREEESEKHKNKPAKNWPASFSAGDILQVFPEGRTKRELPTLYKVKFEGKEEPEPFLVQVLNPESGKSFYGVYLDDRLDYVRDYSGKPQVFHSNMLLSDDIQFVENEPLVKRSAGGVNWWLTGDQYIDVLKMPNLDDRTKLFKQAPKDVYRLFEKLEDQNFKAETALLIYNFCEWIAAGKNPKDFKASEESLEQDLNKMSELKKFANASMEAIQGNTMKKSVLEQILASSGSGWGQFTPGEPVLKVSDVKVGDTLLNESKQFDAKNIFKVSKVDAGRGIMYGFFVNPDNMQEKRMPSDKEFAVWDFELENGEYFKPQQTQPTASSEDKINQILESGKTQAGQKRFLDIKLDSRGAHIKADPKADFSWRGEDKALEEVEDALSDWFSNNGMMWIAPELIGALTDAPIFGDAYLSDDGNSLEDVGDIYWYPDYQLKDWRQEVLDGKEVLFPLGPKTEKKAESGMEELEEGDVRIWEETADGDKKIVEIKAEGAAGNFFEKEALKNDFNGMVAKLKSMPKVWKGIMNSDMADRFQGGINSIDRLEMSNGKVLFFIDTPQHGFYFDENGKCVGEEDGGLDGEWAQFNEEAVKKLTSAIHASGEAGHSGTVTIKNGEYFAKRDDSPADRPLLHHIEDRELGQKLLKEKKKIRFGVNEMDDAVDIVEAAEIEDEGPKESMKDHITIKRIEKQADAAAQDETVSELLKSIAMGLATKIKSEIAIHADNTLKGLGLATDLDVVRSEKHGTSGVHKALQNLIAEQIAWDKPSPADQLVDLSEEGN